jgi:autotransporter passenger strand-loop-strand repeat protein
VASATTVNGGAELVVSGGTMSGATLSGGILEIQSGGTAGTSLITISSGTLVLDDSAHFSGTVAGLATSAQQVDLKDIAFLVDTCSELH